MRELRKDENWIIVQDAVEDRDDGFYFVLRVDDKILEEFGPLSEEEACEMQDDYYDHAEENAIILPPGEEWQ